MQALDLVGPFEVFADGVAGAGRQGMDGYQLVVASVDGQPVATESGLTLGDRAAARPADTRRHTCAARRRRRARGPAPIRESSTGSSRRRRTPAAS